MIGRRVATVAAAALAGIVAMSVTAVDAGAQADPCAPRDGFDPRAPRYVCALYDIYLHPPSEAEVDYWVGVVTPPTGISVALEQVVQALAFTTEGNVRTVADLYERYLDRGPDPEGLRVWADLVHAFSTRVEQLEALLLASGEYRATAGGTRGGFVAAAYADVLGRAASAEEVVYWSERLANGATYEEVAAAIVGSQERAWLAAAGLYEFLGRTPSADEVAFWAAQVHDHGLRLAEASFLGSPEAYDVLGSARPATS